MLALDKAHSVYNAWVGDMRALVAAYCLHDTQVGLPLQSSNCNRRREGCASIATDWISRIHHACELICCTA